MNEYKKNYLTGLGMTAVVLMVGVGSLVRDRVDLGSRSVSESPMHNLLASRDNTNIPEDDYFYEMTRLLKRTYVDPNIDESKLASGAIRGMVVSLGDPHSVFMEKDQFTAYLRRRQGVFDGIGVALELVIPPSAKQVSKAAIMPDAEDDGTDDVIHLPDVKVVAVVPGGPADRAGVKVGDTVDTIDRTWVVNTELVERFKKANADFAAKRISLDQLRKLRNEVRQKTERNMMPQKAIDQLSVGTTGSVQVTWLRDGQLRHTTLSRSRVSLPAVGPETSAFRLRFEPGVVVKLSSYLTGKKEAKLDLTNNPIGDFDSMLQCLSAVAPPGTYGTLTNRRGAKAQPVSIKSGNSRPPKLTLVVDRTTRGVAQVFALALESRGLAKLTGGRMDDDLVVDETVKLEDGTGYTLDTGTYVPSLLTKAQGRKG